MGGVTQCLRKVGLFEKAAADVDSLVWNNVVQGAIETQSRVPCSFGEAERSHACLY